MSSRIAVGVDIGGSGIKGAPVDLEKGEFSAERVRIPTPSPSTPEAIAPIVAQIVQGAGPGPVGVTFPAVIQHGVARSAANVDKSWIDTDVAELLKKETGRHVLVVNDADAAGVAEMQYGAGRDRSGVVIMATLGTGIGTAVFVDGKLVPNSELGHIEIGGHDAESKAADSAREREDLNWKDWSKRLQKYFSTLERLFTPDLFIVGGGVSKKAEKFLPRLDLQTEIIPAQLLNTAGIVGAAWLATRDLAGATEN